MLLLLLAIFARAIHLHIFEGDFLRDEGKKRFLRFENLSANRGMITDRHGRPLAISTPVRSVWANPSLIFETDESIDAFKQVLPSVAAALELAPQELFERLKTHQTRGFIYLKRHLPPQQVQSLLARKIDGIGAVNEFKRYYPASEVAAHLIGFTNIDDHGQEGLELAYDKHLRGAPGKKRVIKDRKGRVVKELGIVTTPVAGGDLQLSIDLRMQYLAYKVLKKAVQQRRASSGSLVALDVNSGEVLALVNEPSYNPNYRATIDPQALRNRAITDAVEPGSTVKPFTVAAAMEAGLVTAHTPIDTTPGYMPVGRKLVKDFRNYGLIDVTTVLAKSSNVGAAKLALDLPQSEMLAGMMARVGFGEESGSSFPGETLGKMPVKTSWRPMELAILSYGYGVSVNVLQLARAYAVIANGGVKVPVSLLKSTSEVPTQQVLDPDIARALTGMLETVVTDKGTAKRAKVSGYRVAGKTGTAVKVNRNGKGYDGERYRALFVGFAPATQPELVVAVVVEDPQGEEHGGGEVAAPIFSDVMTGLLRLNDSVPDDRAPQTAMN